MNAQNIDNTPKVRKESKNKIRVEFERTPLKERLKAKFLSLYFIKKVVWYIFRLVLLVGISFVVLFPFITKITGSFMAPEDFVDATVRLIPKHFTIETYQQIWIENHYLEAFFNTLGLSLSTALIQTFMCCFIAYGLAKFKFKGNKLVFVAVIFSLVIPHATLRTSMFYNFRYFDILGIGQLLNGEGITIFNKTINNGFLQSLDIIPETFAKFPDGATGINLTNTYWPLIILSIGALGFKNGLYIFMLRQFFKGVPDELEESAYIDGSGVFHTFFTIILPLSIPMMITVFLFAFSWQWTDGFYTTVFFTQASDTVLMPNIINTIPKTLSVDEGGALYEQAIKGTAAIMVILPLIVMYLFCQKFLVQGIERSGLTAD